MTVLRPQMTNGLHWVRAELDQSLSRARGMIEQHIENPKDTLPLQQAFVELHQIRGTAAMIQCFGIATFGEEMRQTVHELMHDKLKQNEAAYSALLGAIVQIGDYIDALASGMEDSVLVLHPALNELRVARGKPLLTEADLFAAQMQSLGLQLAVPEQRTEAGGVQLLARKLLPLFQVSLLQWLNKQPEAKTGLARIGKIGDQLAAAATVPAGYLLWRAMAAVTEALLSDSLDESAEVKRLFGATGRQIKFLADEGETAATGQQGDLAYQMLFHVGRSRGDGQRTVSLRRDLDLDAYLPPAAQIESLRKKIHGPTAQLLARVAEEIRSDLAQIKDAIDLAVRAGGNVGPELNDTRARMRRVADTLATLGLQMMQRVVSNQIVLLESANQIKPGAPDMWMEMATAILRVEHSLDSALFRQLRQSPLEQAAGRPELEEHVPHSRDLREGVQALLQESLISLSKLKAQVDVFLKSGETSGLAEAARMMDEISAGLLILEDERASMLTAQLERFMRSPQFLELPGLPDRANRFADAIACIEYYLEAKREQSPVAEKMLENLGGFTDLLDFTDVAEPLLAPSAQADAPSSTAPVVAAPVAPPPAPAVELEAVDPEIRDIFVEEAGEVLDSLKAALPRWTHHPEDVDTLTTIRRAFHTLKGSGRMVGASNIGNFGWAIENLINRCLDQTISVNPDIVDTVKKAVERLPALIEDFRDGRKTEGDLPALIERAENLASGRAAEVSSEPDIIEIFREDAREKLDMVTQWLAAQDRNATAFAVEHDVVRAFHTLRGSAAVVNATALSELAGALETYLDSTRGAGQRLPPPALPLLDDASSTLRLWIDAAGTPSMRSQDAKSWLVRIEELQAALPDAAVQASADRQLAVVFADEAFDLLQKIEHTLNDWSRTPDNSQPARDLKNDCHTLMGAALMSDCPSIAAIARALHDRMHEAQASALLPDAQYFSGMAMLIEGVYQLLDRYRDGDSSDDGSTLAGQIRNLPWNASAAVPAARAAAAPNLQTPSVQAPPAAEPATPYAARSDTELLSLFLSEAQELLENIDAYSSAWEQAPYAVETAGHLQQLVHTLKGSALMAGQPQLGEAAHKLKGLLDRAQHSGTPDNAFFDRLHHISDGLHRVLDDLQHGRTPDYSNLFAEIDAPLMLAAPAEIHEIQMPEVAAQEPEAEIQMPEVAASEPEPEIHMPEVAAAEPEPPLEFKLELMPESAPVQAAEPVFGFKTEFTPAAAPEWTSQPGAALETAIEMPPVDFALEDMPAVQTPPAEEVITMVHVAEQEPAPAVEPLAMEAPAVSPAPAYVPPAADIPWAAESAPTIDADLVEIFMAEAAELIESLEKSLTAWEANPHRSEALRDMQHALHTLKGGARMAGLEVMGTVAHDMESRLNVIEHAPSAADANAFAQLNGDLEALQGMHDRLQRGDYATLAQVAPAGAAQVQSEPVAPVEAAPFEFHQEPASFADPAPIVFEQAPITPIAPVADVPAPFEFHQEPAPVVIEPAAPVAVSESAAVRPRPVTPQGWNPELFWRPEEDVNLAALRRETARVPVETLDGMLNQAGEISIYRSRLEEHNSGIQSQLSEMSQAITRLREQLRMMDIETEAQISARGIMTGGRDKDRYEGDFDPLEMDRYTRMQELSRALSESVGDLANLRGSMEELASEAETLLLQQGRINTEVQTGLMGTLMVPFSRQVARLQRVVKQTAQDTGKQAEAVFSGIESELDRNVLERMTAPLEHLLRNSVVHGIEDPQARRNAGKSEMGQVQVKLWREGTQLLIELRDDGKGLDLKAIRETAIRRGLMPVDANVPDDAVAQFIFEPGFSTASKLTQSAGRGIGMDVVAAEVKQLGGTLELGSEAGKGARFLIRLPLTLSISQALLVGAGEEQFAIPLPSIEGIARIPRDQLEEYYREDGPGFQYGPYEYRVRYLGDFIGVERDKSETANQQKTVSAILVRLGEGLGAQERHVAVVVDVLHGNREVVSKTVGPQVSSISGVSGATILADGSVVLILDVPALAQDRTRRVLLTQAAEAVPAPVQELRDLIMVVDDSITIRRVTERLLLKNGFRVVTAKDGLDAMAQLQTIQPSAILLDIEMPRADGFEVATFVRNTAQISKTPIIMITSRSGDKHRDRARQIGVNRYMIKPFQEEQLVSEIGELLQETRA